MAKQKKDKPEKTTTGAARKSNAGVDSGYREEFAEQGYKLCLLGADDVFLAYFYEVELEVIMFWRIEYTDFNNNIVRAKEDRPLYLLKKEEQRQKRREYRKSKHIKDSANAYVKARRVNDMHFKLRHNVSSLMYARLKSKKSKGALKQLGYSVEELKTHLESQFTHEMNWDNYGGVWQLDHKIPDSWFDYTSIEDEGFKKSWALDNLQPLLATDNLKKGDRYGS